MNLSKVIDQAHYVAGNISGPTRELAALLTAEHSLVIYLHCLNLIL